MKGIIKVSHIWNTNEEKFLYKVCDRVEEYQKEGFEVDVKYSSSTLKSGSVEYSALIIARG